MSEAFLVFGGEWYYPNGGASDFICATIDLLSAQIVIERQFAPGSEYDNRWAEIAVLRSGKLQIVAQWKTKRTILKDNDGAKHTQEEYDISIIDNAVKWELIVRDGLSDVFVSNDLVWLIDGVYQMPVQGAVSDE